MQCVPVFQAVPVQVQCVPVSPGVPVFQGVPVPVQWFSIHNTQDSHNLKQVAFFCEI